MGQGSKKIAYRWILDSEAGYTILLMRRELPHETMPNAIVRCTSLPLMGLGTRQCGKLARVALSHMGAVVERNKISRVDLCADLPGMSVEPLYNAYSAGHYLSRARNTSEHLEETQYDGYRVANRPTGYNIGRGNLLCRIYDKAIESRYQYEKLELLVARRWGEFVVRAVRVEFQLRRERLKSLGVDSVNDWFKKRRAVADYLTHEWLYFTDGPCNTKHRSKNVLLPEWREVQDCFAQWCGIPNNAVLAPLPKSPPNVDHWYKQLVGLCLTIHATQERPIVDQESFIQETLYVISEAIEDRNMAEELRRRVLERKAGR